MYLLDKQLEMTALTRKHSLSSVRRVVAVLKTQTAFTFIQLHTTLWLVGHPTIIALLVIFRSLAPSGIYKGSCRLTVTTLAVLAAEKVTLAKATKPGAIC